MGEQSETKNQSATVDMIEVMQSFMQGFYIGQVSSLFALHRQNGDFMSQLNKRGVLFCISLLQVQLDPLREKIGGHSILDLLCMGFLVDHPAHQLMRILSSLSFQGIDLCHGGPGPGPD